MNDPNSYGFQGDLKQLPGESQAGITSPGQYKFSAEELKVLGECNRESFMQRSLPLSTMLGLSTFVGIQNGHLRPNPRFGAIPKVSLAVVVGYFLGKLSYQQACAEKLMALPGSYIGQLLRDRRDGKVGRVSQPKQPPSMFGAGPSDIYSDAGPGSSLDLDTDRPMFNDDSYRPDADSSGPAPAAPGRPSLSYEEIRRKNRGDFAETKQDPYRMDSHSMPPITRARAAPPSSAPTNKYGDSME